MESRKIEKYSVYSDGRIHDDFYDRDVTPYPGVSGYLRVKLFLRGKYSQMYVHEIMAKLFMPNYNPSYRTIHKDNNVLNNNIENLEQIDPNIITSKKRAEDLPSYPVTAFNPYDMSTIKFNGLDEAALWLKSIGVEDEIYKIKLNIFNVTDDYKLMAYNYKWNSV